MAKTLGLTFTVKLMERKEKLSQFNYELISKEVKMAKNIKWQGEEHEKRILGLIKEESLDYAGSIVLGLNDTLVELTGALAALTLAFQNSRLIAVTGIITGIAASLSMAASEYLSTKAETN